MDKVLADLDYAIANITLTSDQSTRITKNVARAYKTRICLFEASFRKYHTNYNKQATAAAWYEEVVKEADEIRGFSLHQGAAPDKGYRELFIAKSAFADETILSVALSSISGFTALQTAGSSAHVRQPPQPDTPFISTPTSTSMARRLPATPGMPPHHLWKSEKP